MKTLYSRAILLLIVWSSNTGFGMENKESDHISVPLKSVASIQPIRTDYTRRSITKELLVKEWWGNLPPHLKLFAPIMELFIMPLELGGQKLDIINKERYGNSLVDQGTASEIRKYLGKSRLGKDSGTVDLYRLDTNTQDTFISTVSGSTWVNVDAYNTLTQNQRELATIAEGNFKAYQGPAAKIIIPGAMALGALYSLEKYYRTYLMNKPLGKYQYLLLARLKHQNAGIIIGGTGLYLIASKVLGPKLFKKGFETTIEKVAGDQAFDSGIKVITYKNTTSDNETA